MKMRKLVSIAMAGLLMLSMSVSVSAAKLQGKIVFGTHRTDKADTTIRELADKFEKANPGTRIEIESMKDVEQLVPTRAAAGELPDITVIPTSWTPNDFPKFLLPLTLDASKFYASERGEYESKYYAHSFQVNIGGIVVYNDVSFKKAGITAVPRTLPEFFAACEKLKKAGIIPFAINYKDKWPLSTYYYDYINLYNANPAALNELYKKPLLEKGNGLYEAIVFLRDMKAKGYLEPDLFSTNWDSFKPQHAMGKIAMTFLASWYPAQVVENGADAKDVKVFPMPGLKAASFGGDRRYGVAKTSKNPELAKAFFEYLSKNDVYAKAIGATPASKSAKGDPILGAVKAAKVQIIGETSVHESERGNLQDKAELSDGGFIQEAIIAPDLDAFAKKWNDKWAAAQKALGYTK